MKLLILPFILMATSQAFGVPQCDVAKTIATKDSIKRFGNAFAVSKNELVINQHSLLPETTTIQLQFASGAKLIGQIESSDFYTDLALIRVDSALKECPLDTETVLKHQDPVNVFGTESVD